jgi:hypothetical protein
MPRKDYVWDAEAARRIEQQELDKHFQAQAKHYTKLAQGAWDGLQEVSGKSPYLKNEDLAEVLLPVITHDAITIKAMTDKGLPEPGERLAGQWYSWFTHYVVEQFTKSNN